MAARRNPIRFNETALALARSRSVSLRTTMLAFIGGKLGLKPGDRLMWTRQGKSSARVEKGEGEHTSTLTQVGPSLRTTIPKEIARLLKLDENDVLVWDLDKECEGGTWYALIGKRRMA